MEYTFNQEKIKQLAEGKAILGHTGERKDKELLNKISKAVFVELDIRGTCKYYYLKTGQYDWFNEIPTKFKHLPIIPLHDFVSPTKEELATIESIDARLKELEKIIAKDREEILSIISKRKAKEEQPKAEWKPKVGEWVYVESFDTYILVESIDDKRAHGYNQNQKDPYHVLINGLRPATEEEIGNYMLAIAEQKGFVMGAKYKWPNKPAIKDDIRTVNSRLVYNVKDNDISHDCQLIYTNNQWAEVLPQAKEYSVKIIQNHSKYEIRVTGLTQAEAEKYAETIKNALNHG